MLKIAEITSSATLQGEHPVLSQVPASSLSAAARTFLFAGDRADSMVSAFKDKLGSQSSPGAEPGLVVATLTEQSPDSVQLSAVMTMIGAGDKPIPGTDRTVTVRLSGAELEAYVNEVESQTRLAGKDDLAFGASAKPAPDVALGVSARETAAAGAMSDAADAWAARTDGPRTIGLPNKLTLAQAQALPAV
ncbi:MAG: hypothetical protein AAFQ82_15085, partial [Myxococcota bacterium]